MNITEFMSFDLEWFTTLPGILITGGVVVLLIALILFIASNKKDKNKSQEVAPVENPVSTETQASMDTNIDNNMMMGAAAQMINPMEPVNNNVIANSGMDINESFGVNPTEPVANDMPTIPVVETPTTVTYSAQPASTNVVDFSTPAIEVPEVASVEPIEPVVNNNDVIPEVTPYAETVASNVNEQSMNVTPTYSEPVVTPAEPITPVVETPVTPVQEQPVIYGGANPASVNQAPVQPRPVIYGGANPLENTTTLPRMTSHQAYSASSSNVIQPAVESQPAVVETPVIETPVTPVISESVVIPVEPAVSQVEVPVQTVPEIPTSSVMPMTGAEMFARPSSEASDEIETLEF